MSELARRKYLERYAEPEARFAGQLGQQYCAAVALPLCGEDASFLEGVAVACESAATRVLVIAVVNGRDDAPPAVAQANQRLLELLGGSVAARQVLDPVEGSVASAVLTRHGHFDLLAIDRASPGQRLPPGEGVGLARRIGVDVAFALHEAEGIVSPWLSCTDGDARLPAEHFRGLEQLEPLAPDGTRRVALTLPFWHVASGDPAVDVATFGYELSLRYYTLGLASVGSPYAYESMGSSLGVHADAYAEVRGFPRLKAGEDFYLLDKLAKVGAVHRPAREPIQLLARVSDRVPFGTGARVGALVRGEEELRVYHPRVFELLGVVLTALRYALSAGRVEALVDALGSALDAGTVGAVSSVLEELGAFEALQGALGGSPDRVVRERRLLTWFDALRTLRFIHLLEGPAALPRLPLAEAFARAPFCGFLRGPQVVSRDEPDLNAWRLAFAQAEQALPTDAGVNSAILRV